MKQRIKIGLYLNPDEAKLFPKDTISPLFRNGDTIIAYQVNQMVCPNLYYENGISNCKIYKNRPLGCRTFPLSEDNKVDNNICRSAAQNMTGEWDYSSLRDEKEALKKQFAEINATPEPTAMYLMNLRKWMKNG
jgi:Fe-S-cluster containining protein